MILFAICQLQVKTVGFFRERLQNFNIIAESFNFGQEQFFQEEFSTVFSPNRIHLQAAG